MLIGLLSLSGCLDKTEDDSQIPWAQPASWEDTPAGMGAVTERYGR